MAMSPTHDIFYPDEATRRLIIETAPRGLQHQGEFFRTPVKTTPSSPVATVVREPDEVS